MRLVTAGAAGTVITAVPDFVVSAIEVAVTVTVCEELVAAGSVIVAAVVEVPDRVPALVLQLTPAEFRSSATVAVKVVASVPSTVVAAAVTVTEPTDGEPPQPAVDKTTNDDTRIARHDSARIPQRMTPSRLRFYWPCDY